MVCGAVGCFLRTPPRPRGPRRPTQQWSRPAPPVASSCTGSLLAGAGRGPTAPVTMVSGLRRKRKEGTEKGMRGRGRRQGACAIAGSGERLSPQSAPAVFRPPGIAESERVLGTLDAPRCPQGMPSGEVQLDARPPPAGSDPVVPEGTALKPPGRLLAGSGMGSLQD